MLNFDYNDLKQNVNIIFYFGGFTPNFGDI